ncbi:MAG: hypothetical protein WKF30_16765, partial [Pyrinomonadaceae bacterium]
MSKKLRDKSSAPNREWPTTSAILDRVEENAAKSLSRTASRNERKASNSGGGHDLDPADARGDNRAAIERWSATEARYVYAAAALLLLGALL